MDEMEFHDALTDGEGGSSTASENIVQVVEASVEEVIEEVLSVTSLPNTAQNESNEPKDQEEMEMSSEPEPPTEEYSYEEQRAQFLKKIDKEQVEEIIENVETAVDRVVSEALLNSDVDVDVEDEGKISEASEVDSMKTKRDKFLERLEHSPPDEMETKREEFLEKFEHPPPNEMETKRDKFVEKVEHPPPTEMEQKRDEFMEKLEHSLSSSPPAATSSGWGSMFSALTGITTTVKATASTQMDKIYDALDPNMPEDNNDEANADSKSIRGLLDKISPTSTKEDAEVKASSWLSGFDKTFDYASDKIGSALFGGIKKFENTVGVSIEPVSSSSSLNEVIYDVDATADVSSQSPLGDASSVHSSNSTRDQVESIGLGLIGALGKIGQKTANIVVSTKERITPLLLQSPVGRTKVDRTELKKSFAELFEEFSGNDALERLQLQSTNASIQLKTQLKTLNPQKLKVIQGELKGVGNELDNIQPAMDEGDWNQITFTNDDSEAELVHRLRRSIEESVTALNGLGEDVEELRANVDTSLPPDNPTLIIYICRLNLAKMLSASLHLLLMINFEKTDESTICTFARNLRGRLESVQIPDGLIDENRQKAVTQMVSADASQAQCTLRDAILTLQPQLRLSKFNSRQ